MPAFPLQAVSRAGVDCCTDQDHIAGWDTIPPPSLPPTPPHSLYQWPHHSILITQQYLNFFYRTVCCLYVQQKELNKWLNRKRNYMYQKIILCWACIDSESLSTLKFKQTIKRWKVLSTQSWTWSTEYVTQRKWSILAGTRDLHVGIP